jgi:DNA modification methylase
MSDQRVVHGSAFDVLPDLAWDVMVTDAPYGVGLGYDDYDDTVENLDLLIKGLTPYLQDARAFVFTGVQNLHRWPQPYWTLAWVTPSGASTGRYGFSCWQPILGYGMDVRLQDGAGRYPDTFMDYAPARQGDAAHVCEKPLSVMRWLLERVTRPGDVVVDPFCGSGTTLVAARELGLDAIGVEMSEAYVERANRRLAQGGLF